MNDIPKSEIFNEQLGLLLRTKREQAGLSLDDVVVDINKNSGDSVLTKNGLALIEKNQQKMQVYQFVELAKVLKFSVAELLDETKKAVEAKIYPEIQQHL